MKKNTLKYGTFYYKRSSDSNSSSDPKVNLVYNLGIPFLYASSGFSTIRNIENNKLATYQSDTIIYDPVYEENNNNKKRFNILASYKFCTGDSIVWLYDNETANIFAVKFMDTLDPKVHQNKTFTFEIAPVADPGFDKIQVSNYVTNSSKKLAKVYFNKSKPTVTATSFIVKGDIGVNTADNIRIELSTGTVLNSSELTINNFMGISTQDLDLSKTDFYVQTIFQINHMQDSLTSTNLCSDMNTIYLPIDV